MRKQYPSTFKTKAVMELLKEEKTLNQLAGEYEVHPTQVHSWRQRLLDELPQVFSREQQVSETELKKQDQLIEQRYGEIGRLTTELNWLQKKWSQC